MDLSQRSTAPEMMDSDAVDAVTYARCLADLGRLNRLTLTHRPTLRWLARASSDLPRSVPISVLDVACGGGDLLRAIRRWADGSGRAVVLQGIDLNPRSAVVAQAATPADSTPADRAITYLTGDVFAYAPDPAPDFIVSSQFLHHLTDAEAVRFLRWLDRHAARGWYVADLQRHPLPYYGFRLLARIARWHPIVRTDGTISIARGFRLAEAHALVAAAGVEALVSRAVPFRIGIERRT